MDFENEFRGSRELISQRLLDNYSDLLSLAHHELRDHLSVDLGCGRGEWLEILASRGFKAEGVELDLGMVNACRDRNLSVHARDAISFLREQSADSLGIISAFHLVEHLQHEEVESLLKESHRALVPGGLLILETPNSENVVVGTNTFYLDPTHLRPIPALALAFATKSQGFETAHIWRLGQSLFTGRDQGPSLSDVFFGVSPDYAIVAQKPGNAVLHSLLDHELTRQRGLSLRQVTDLYQSEMSRQIEELITKRVSEHLEALLNSRSWRITAPLRKVSNYLNQKKSGRELNS